MEQTSKTIVDSRSSFGVSGLIIYAISNYFHGTFNRDADVVRKNLLLGLFSVYPLLISTRTKLFIQKLFEEPYELMIIVLFLINFVRTAKVFT
mgnify:CR=1 FL=1